MARSLDELIDFLLEGIALKGATGISFQHLADLVQQFYSPSQSQQSVTNSLDPELLAQSQRLTLGVDRLFLSKVWKWLARHPDVSIGKNRQYNRQNLDELEEQFPEYTKLGKNGQNVSEANFLPPSVIQHVSDVHENISSGAIAPKVDGPHIFVNDERMSLAICGHLPDLNRVPASEWALILIIAAAGPDGILQGELTRDSGQDKRSVPKRTDALHEKGYITKRSIYLKGNKTSRLYLRRFLSLQKLEGQTGTTIDKLTVRHVAQKLFDLLRNNPLMPQEDLADALGMVSPGRARILVQLIRQLGKKGCLKRVRTAFGPSSKSKDLKVCIQFLKEPTEEDWQTLSDEMLDLDQSVDTLASLYEAETAQGLGTDAENADLERTEQLDFDIPDDSQTGALRMSIPQWNPDRNLVNLLHNAAEASGEAGITNLRARSSITGPFIKRTLESLLVRVSHRTLLSQPEGLKHLCIFRMHVYVDNIWQYFHYTSEPMIQKIKNGKTTWNEVVGGKEYLTELRKAGKDESVILEPADTDVFGFAKRPAPVLQVQDGEVSMSKLLQESKVKPTYSRVGEPIIIEVTPGCYEICIEGAQENTERQEHTGRGRESGRGRGRGQNQRAGRARGRGRGRPPKIRDRPDEIEPNADTEELSQQALHPIIESDIPTAAVPDVTPEPALVLESASARPTKSIGTVGKALGRPRKFTRGTEKYWRDMCGVIVQAKHPEKPKKDGKAGITNDPGALRIFNSRPTDFDKTILQAMELGLPVASRPEDISQQWIGRMNSIMHRSQPGLYITPVGYHAKLRGMDDVQLFILRSSRLHEVDWSDRQKCWPWQQIASSASHSLRYRRYYPQPQVDRASTELLQRASVRSSQLPRIRSEPIDDSSQEVVHEEFDTAKEGDSAEPPRDVVYDTGVSMTTEARESSDVANEDSSLADKPHLPSLTSKKPTSKTADAPLRPRGRPSRRDRVTATVRSTRTRKPTQKAAEMDNPIEAQLGKGPNPLPLSTTNDGFVTSQPELETLPTTETEVLESDHQSSSAGPLQDSSDRSQAPSTQRVTDAILQTQESNKNMPRTISNSGQPVHKNGSDSTPRTGDAFLDLLQQYAHIDVDHVNSEAQSPAQELPTSTSKSSVTTHTTHVSNQLASKESSMLITHEPATIRKVFSSTNASKPVSTIQEESTLTPNVLVVTKHTLGNVGSLHSQRALSFTSDNSMTLRDDSSSTKQPVTQEAPILIPAGLVTQQNERNGIDPLAGLKESALNSEDSVTSQIGHSTADQAAPQPISDDSVATRVTADREDQNALGEQDLETETAYTEIAPVQIEGGNSTEAPQITTAPNGRKRARSAYPSPDVMDRDSSQEPGSPAKKRAKTGNPDINAPLEARRPQVSKLCRILVLELVGLCSGLLPNVPWTLRRAIVPRWAEADIKPEQLNAKNVRAAIKALCESGKLKQITFAFRAKSGLMTRMSIVALQGIDSVNPAVLAVQEKMKEMEPADYIPPELEAESQRVPNPMNKKRYRKEIQADEDADDTDERAISKSRRKRTKTAKSLLDSSNLGGMSGHLFDLAGPAPEDGNRSESLTRSDPSRELQRRVSISPSPEMIISENCGFLTLKVPKIGELKLPVGTVERYKIQPAYLFSKTAINFINSNTADFRTKTARRKGLRRKRTARFDPQTQKLIWKKPKKLSLPSSLEGVPNIKLCRDQAALAFSHDPRSAHFDAEVDCVEDWESKSFELFDEARPEHLSIISHTFSTNPSDSFQIKVPIQFKALVRFNTETGDEHEEDFPTTEKWPPFTDALQTRPKKTTSMMRKAHSRRKRALEENVEDDDEFHGYSTSTTKRRAAGSRTKRPRRNLRTAEDEEFVDLTAGTPFRRNRITQLLRTLTEEDKYRIVVAVIIVRTLVGGFEKYIDWQTVRLLLPAYEEQHIMDAWKTMANRYRSDVQDLTENLQYRYIEALANGEVPSVSFDVAHETDWNGIYHWALEVLDKSLIKKIEDLPADRAQLLQRNDYVFPEMKGMRDMVGYNIIISNPRKEELVSSMVFGRPTKASTPKISTLGVKYQAEEEESDLELSRAKSWIMAALLTPEDKIDVKVVQDKLLTLAPTLPRVEEILDRSLRCLQRDRLVARSRTVAGPGSGTYLSHENIDHLRRYEVSARYFEQFDFRRMISAQMLKTAAKYKLEVLDPAFRQGLPVHFAKDTVIGDGEMVAILNLVAMDMVRVQSGDDVPASRWGLEWQKHGYTTRMIDKKVLAFSVSLNAVESKYFFGDPVADLRASEAAAIPRGEIDQADGQGRIPIWFDIIHAFQHGLWEMVLGAVLGIVSVRPGINVREMSRMLWHAASFQQLQMVLDWAERLNLIKKTSSQGGWESCEWWWMGVGVGGGDTWRT